MRERAAEQNGQGHAKGHTAEYDGHSLAKDKHRDAAFAGSQGHAHTDFAAALIDGVSHDSIETNRSETKGQQSEYAEQADTDFRSPKRLINYLGSRADIFQSESRID